MGKRRYLSFRQLGSYRSVLLHGSTHLTVPGTARPPQSTKEMPQDSTMDTLEHRNSRKLLQSTPTMEVCMALLQATSALRAGMLLTKEQMAALRAAAYPLSTPKRAPNPSIIVTPQKRSRSG